MRKALICLVSLLVFVSGCSTGYQKFGLMGGYKDSCLEDNMHTVSFVSNAYTSRQKTSDFAMLRCADLTLEKGCNYFILLDQNFSLEPKSCSAPITDNSKNGDSVLFYDTTYDMAFPTSRCIIKILKEKPEGVAALDAQQIRNDIVAKYKIQDTPKQQ